MGGMVLVTGGRNNVTSHVHKNFHTKVSGSENISILIKSF
jgi:hypothetical protein